MNKSTKEMECLLVEKEGGKAKIYNHQRQPWYHVRYRSEFREQPSERLKTAGKLQSKGDKAGKIFSFRRLVSWLQNE